MPIKVSFNHELTGLVVVSSLLFIFKRRKHEWIFFNVLFALAEGLPLEPEGLELAEALILRRHSVAWLCLWHAPLRIEGLGWMLAVGMRSLRVDALLLVVSGSHLK